MTQPLPPPQIPTSNHTMTSTVIAVAGGVILGVIGLIVLAVVLLASGRDGAEWAGTIALGLGILALVEGNNWRKKHQRR